jgi:hypothetical protein
MSEFLFSGNFDDINAEALYLSLRDLQKIGCNQFAFHLFNKAKANGVIIGKENYLYEEKYINFYYYTKNFLVETKKLKLIKYIVGKIHCYEWSESIKQYYITDCL